MRYCNRCILPDTRPHIRLDDSGVCNACQAHGRKPQIDWAAREKAFRNVVDRAISRSKGYDCLVPVSGGKDSTWQIVKCLEYRLNPLAVTWKSPARTALGAANLANLISLGVDHIDYQINPKVERIFLYRALTERGATAIPMHLAMFHICLTIAVRFDIPLVVWGENSAAEYGSSDQQHEGFRLDAQWVRTYGVTDGTTAQDWIDDQLTRKKLTAYFGPTDRELDEKGILAVFLGYYFPWDPQTTLAVAQQHGFRARDAGAKTGYWSYADIDDDFIAIHHYLKWYKFGMTRLFDNLSVDIRNNKIARDRAIEIVRTTGDQTPHDDIHTFCQFVGITVPHFFEVIERFRNPDIWVKHNGTWIIKDFLIPDWSWT